MSEKKEDPEKQIPTELRNEADRMIANGLTEGLLGFNPFTEGVQLSQVDTLFKNNRWYLVSNMRQLLSEMYVEYGIIQTIVDVPVDDGMRGGVKVKTSQLSEQDVNDLEAEMAYQGDLQEAGQALKWNRLFGGAGLIIVTDQPAKTKLDLKSLYKNPLAFRAADMWELYYSKMNVDDESMDETLRFKSDMENYNYYGQTVHQSRVLKFKGLKPPSFVRPRLRGWGFSVVESIIRSVNQYLKATNLSFEVLDEFKLDIYRMKDLLNTLLSPDGTAKVQNRVSLANKQKNYQNAIVLDSEDEYEQKQLSFSGLADTMSGIRLQLASDLRMPMTKIFGMSSAGFNSGEDDIENYNAMVEGTIREPARFHILRMVELRCQQMFGMIPDDLEIEFEPLRVLSSEQEETVKTQKFNRLLQARQAGEITSMEFRLGCNSDDLLPHKLEENDDLDTSYDGPEVASEPLPVNPQNKAQNELEHKYIACIAPICDGWILTGKRKDTGLWTFPGGHIDGPETPLEAAIRECKEECGIVLEQSQCTKVGTKSFESHRKEGQKFTVTAFTAKLDSRIPPKTIDDPDQEIALWRWVELKEGTPELKPEARHAKEDLIIQHLLGR